MRKYPFAALVVAATIALNAVPVSAKKRVKPVAAKVVAAPAPVPAAKAAEAPSPGEIVAAAPASDWTAIAPSDLLVMELAPDVKGKARRVVIQLMPAPFSQGWIGNIRKLATARFWDGTSVNRVQDNYVVQWGDPDGEDAGKAKPLPDGLVKVSERDYATHNAQTSISGKLQQNNRYVGMSEFGIRDAYSPNVGVMGGWLVGFDAKFEPPWVWPLHCYGMVGVGRNLSPDTGTGAELYTVIGHAPRHLDRNIALVGRIIEGMEHMSSLPRGTGALGFYETPEERTAILSVRMGDKATGLPAYEYLNTDNGSFAKYADGRANRRDPFFIRPAGGADICNIPVPVRRKG
jgi:peptidylprolyl isomerase